MPFAKPVVMAAWQDYARLFATSDPPLGYDVGLVNLLCAVDLPGAERMDIGRSLRTLDDWGEKVRFQTCNSLGRFHRQPGDFENSEAYFRALVLITTLQRDCGLCYDPSKIPEDAVFGPGDSFIFGAIDKRLGTCATLPVVYAAVGRRLGYPLKLVSAKGPHATHLFVRWEDPRGDRFNIEATDKGMRCPPDDHYRTGRYEITPQIEQQGRFLTSKTPREELASFLAERYCCWKDLANHHRAVEAMAWAAALAPKNAMYANTLQMALDRWLHVLNANKPKEFPKISIRAPRRFPVSLPEHFEKDIFGLRALDCMLRDSHQEASWWGPMRRGESLAQKPVEALVDFGADGGCTIRFRVANGPLQDNKNILTGEG
jgi:hypothetical protein